MKFTLKTPGKINWFLSILNKRADGYHNIISVLQYINLFDSVSFEDAKEIEIISDLDLPAKDNLVFRAAFLLKEHASCKRGARITLKKGIPVAAGLGGGSSDAAVTLIGLHKLWGLTIDRTDLLAIAAQIGSDVPFFLCGPFSQVDGRGEKVSDIPDALSVDMLLVKPDIRIPAALAYESFRTELTKKPVDIKLFCSSLVKRDFNHLQRLLFNDLEQPVFEMYPAVMEIKEKLIGNGAVFSMMSGSGPTVYGIFHSAEEAEQAAYRMGDNWCRVVKTLSRSVNDYCVTGTAKDLPFLL
jgi:4-diphosphocytidyl-2-C-methyl-D-erythritol kinase